MYLFKYKSITTAAHILEQRNKGMFITAFFKFFFANVENIIARRQISDTQPLHSIIEKKHCKIIPKLPIIIIFTNATIIEKR